MNKPERCSISKGIEWKGWSYRMPTCFRLSVYGVLQSILIVFLLASIPPKTMLGQDNYDSTYDKANLFFRQGKYEDALEQYKKANRIKQNTNLECLWGMAQTFSKLGAYKNTLQTCDRLIELSGDNPYFLLKALNMKGNELSAAARGNDGKPDLGKFREAEAAYREVLKVSPSSNMAHYNLGVTLIRMNRVNEGIGELQVYIERAEEEDISEKARRIIKNPRRAIDNYTPDFSITTADGEYISSDELAGKVILIDFWGAWCPPCVGSIPYLSDLAKKYKKDPFVLLSVDVRDDEAKWRDFIAKNKMNWMHARDGNNKITQLFQVNAFPSYILVDHEGVIQYRGIGSGSQTENDISNAVKKALKNLASSPERPGRESPVSSSPDVVSTAPSAPADSGSKVPVTGEIKSETAAPKNEGGRTYLFRIPKPIVEVAKAEPPNLGSGFQNPPDAYRIHIRNWASMPDDLFQSSKNLMACSAGTMIPRGDLTPTRLEIIIRNEQGQMVRGFCDPPRQEVLQNLMLLITNQSKPGKIYLELKDRLTGNMVQSDPVVLP